jgi:dTDP-glucose 4,6-dehydratase
MKKILITGATGFLGHFLVREFVSDHKVVCLVRPGTKNLSRLEDVQHQVEFIEHDVRTNYDSLLNKLNDVEVILHLAGNPSAEASINDPTAVVIDNVVGTAHLLELARKLPLKRFFFYSAGEIFGPIPPGTDSNENDRYNSVSPYAASKVGGQELCISYTNTFNVPVSIIHITNTFGQRSQGKRFPVITIKKLLNDEALDVHIGPDGSIGGRRWLHAANVALHTRFILDNQKTLCEKWNSAGNKFINNLEFAEMIAGVLGKKLKHNFIPVDRPGHDSYFSLSPDKIYNAGWVEHISMEQRLQETVDWYKQNITWLTRE